MNSMVAEGVDTVSKIAPLNSLLITVAIGMLGLILRFQLASRKLRMEEDIGDRKGWGELIQTLTDQVKRLTDEVGTLQKENHQLREEIRSLHGTIDGMRRENLQAGNSAARAVAESLPEGAVPPATMAALERMKGTGE